MVGLPIILCDFDGTISQHDVAVLILDQFAEGWEIYDEMLLAGQITIQECMIKQFGLIKADMDSILELVDTVQIREGFFDLIEFCKSKKITIKIVSAGIDFVINHVLAKYNLDLEVIAAKTIIGDKFDITIPPFNSDIYRDFKEAESDRYKKLGHQVIFVGDGGSDYYGASAADIVFSVKNSALSKFCEKENISHIEFDHFQEIINYLTKIRPELDIK